ncbi:MAG: hypothetical protein GY749_04085 [Desulfobacteraceae bacterium]|nr:hypothetical protein [Desulfobacteraceae bacterium]
MSRDALLIGINTYDRLKSLNSPSEDAEAIARLLNQYSDFNVRRIPAVKDKTDDSIRVGRKTRVTQTQLEEALVQLFKPVGQSIPDTVLLFFSGHGLRKDRGIQEGYLAVSDTDPNSGKWGLSLQWLRRLFQESPVRQQIIWLDCCYSGELLNFDEADPGYRGKGRDRCFIAASREYEVAYEETAGSHGVLTGALLKGLDPSQQLDGVVTNYTLIVSLNQMLRGVIQRPIYANSGGQIILTSCIRQETDTCLVSESVCPYKGLAYFDCNDEDPKYFYGRTSLTDQLLEKVREGNFLAVLGASGSGKSSVVRAGLLHQLKLGHRLSGSEQWPIYIFRPDENPLKSLALTFLDTALTGIERADQLTKAEDLISKGAVGLDRLITATAGGGRLVLVADQFEEVFTLCRNEKERQEFFECLMGALELADDKLCLVITLRADFFGKCSEQDYAGLADYIQSHLVTVLPMTPEELKQAIIEPAKQVGLEAEPELVTQMIEDVKDSPGSLPLLQYTLTELWNRRITEQLRLSDYIRMGGVKGTLARRADEVYNSLSSEEQQTAKRIFLELTQLGEGTEDTRRRISKQSLVTSQQSEELVNSVIQKLSDAKLVVTSEVVEKGTEAGRIAVIDVAHEALIRHWSLLRRWLDKNRDGIRFQRRLDDAAKHWENQKRPDGLLWQPPDLDLLKEFHSHAQDMTTLQVNFYQASENKQRRSKQARRITRTILFVMILLALMIGIFFNRANNQKAQALRAESVSLTFSSLEQTRANKPIDGVILALKALPKSVDNPDRPYVSEAEAALYEAVFSYMEKTVLKECLSHYSAFSPDGKHIITLDEYEFEFENQNEYANAQLWNAETGELTVVLKGHKPIDNIGWLYREGIVHAAFNPDGQKIVTVAKDKTIRIWDAKIGKQLKVFDKHDGQVWHVAFSPDGQFIATASTDATARIWNINSGEQLFVLNHEGHVNHVDFNPDGWLIVTASRDKTARIWDAKTGKQLTLMKGHTDSIRNAEFSPNGRRLVTASSYDGTARIWDVDNGNELFTLETDKFPHGKGKSFARASFSPDGKYILTIGINYIQLWNANNGEKLAKHIYKKHICLF